MASEWYYVKAGQQVGPVSPTQLKDFAANGSLLPTDLIWKQGMSSWVTASSSPSLFPRSPITPTPQNPPRYMSSMRIALVVLGLVLILVLGGVAVRGIQDNIRENKRGAKESEAATEAINRQTLEIAGGANYGRSSQRNSSKHDTTDRKTENKPQPIEIKTKDQLLDFVDNTKNYKGKTLTVMLTYHAQQTLRDVTDQKDFAIIVCPFMCYNPVNFEINIDISPSFTFAEYKKGEDMPNAKHGDALMVTFLCSAGSLKEDNQCVKITRAK